MLEPPAVPALVGESVTLRCAVWGGKAEKAEFYKDNELITIDTITEDSYIITNATQDHTGQYRCHATYRYSHISAEAARQEGDSDAQEFKVIGNYYNNTIITITASPQLFIYAQPLLDSTRTRKYFLDMVPWHLCKSTI